MTEPAFHKTHPCGNHGPDTPVTHKQLEERLGYEIKKRNARWDGQRAASVIGYVVLVVGLAIALKLAASATTTAKKFSIHTRSVQCKHSTMLDRQRYETYYEGKINRQTLDRFLNGESQYRRELQPAPGCTDAITQPEPGSPPLR